MKSKMEMTNLGNVGAFNTQVTVDSQVSDEMNALQIEVAHKARAIMDKFVTRVFGNDLRVHAYIEVHIVPRLTIMTKDYVEKVVDPFPESKGPVQ